MSNIVMGRAGDAAMPPSAIAAMFKFRKQVFEDLLGWEVNSRDGIETDDYDALDPVYMIARSSQYHIQGCWRLLPTTGPYMLRDVFSEMLEGQPAPRDPQIWELSRLAVLPTERTERERNSLCPVTRGMFQSVTDFALRHGITRYVFVTSVGIERMLKRMGVPVSRFGSGKAVRLGRVLSVVLWVEVNDQLVRAVFRQGAIPPAKRADLSLAA
jgi:acyl homoserine lactone synthase